MRHSKKKGDQTPLTEQDVMGSEADFAPGGGDGAQALGAAFDGSTGADAGAGGTDTSVGEPGGSGTDDLATEREKYLRLAAEYDNYRKRSAKERQDAGTRAQAELVRQLVEALDDVARFAHIDPATTDASTIVQGVDMVEKKLLKVLGARGSGDHKPAGRDVRSRAPRSSGDRADLCARGRPRRVARVPAWIPVQVTVAAPCPRGSEAVERLIVATLDY